MKRNKDGRQLSEKEMHLLIKGKEMNGNQERVLIWRKDTELLKIALLHLTNRSLILERTDINPVKSLVAVGASKKGKSAHSE